MMNLDVLDIFAGVKTVIMAPTETLEQRKRHGGNGWWWWSCVGAGVETCERRRSSWVVSTARGWLGPEGHQILVAWNESEYPGDQVLRWSWVVWREVLDQLVRVEQTCGWKFLVLSELRNTGLQLYLRIKISPINVGITIIDYNSTGKQVQQITNVWYCSCKKYE